jgi:hypothetical protein
LSHRRLHGQTAYDGAMDREFEPVPVRQSGLGGRTSLAGVAAVLTYQLSVTAGFVVGADCYSAYEYQMQTSIVIQVH